MEDTSCEPKSLSRLGLCNVCREQNAKYKCPRCGIKTCSLTCVQTHKNNQSCSGIRNKVEMVPRENMDNLTLLNDYRFLEEIDHKLDDGLRHPLRKFICQKQNSRQQDLPNHLKCLRYEARKRGTALHFMPQYFFKHRNNSTRFHFQENIIRWHIKWVFHQADGVSFEDQSISENLTVGQVLRKYIEPWYYKEEFEKSSDNHLGVGENDVESNLWQEKLGKLSYYQSASYRRIAVLLLSEMSGDGPKFQELFLSKSIRLNLADKTVLEHPTLYVVLRDHMDCYLEYKEDEDEPVLFTKQVIANENIGNSQEKYATQISKRNKDLKFFRCYSSEEEIDMKT